MKRVTTLLPYALLTLSGACALVYEVTWARYFALFLGHTTLAHMCVLCAFMGGLALGSILIGRMTTGFRRPLAVYGLLEILVGLYAVFSPGILGLARSAMLAVGSGLEPGAPAWLGLKLIISTATLIFPTVLMGGTFPVLMQFFRPSSSSAADKSEWLYAVNCFGGVSGALLAGFVLIPSLGSKATLLWTGFANIGFGFGARLLARSAADQIVQETASGGKHDRSRHPLAIPIYIAIGLSGLVSMVYELVWIRIFAVTLGSSTYSFTLMLAAFITGITLGSLTVGIVPWFRRNPLVGFAIAEIAIALTVVLGIPLYERLPFYFWRWSYLLNRVPESYILLNLCKYSLCFMIMLLPTFFFGMTLPLAIKSIARRDERIGRDSGFVYGANTAGTLIGSLLTGLVLIRVLGLRHSIEAGLIVNLLVGVLLLLMSNHSRKRPIAGFSFAAVILLVILIPAWHPLSFAEGTFRQINQPPPNWSEYIKSCEERELHFYLESDDGTVAITGFRGGSELSLFINGKADASSYSDLCTQVLLGQLPMFFKPDARDVLVVGLGSGVSANSILTHPGTRVDGIEISPAVVEAARFFKEHNGGVHDNERFNLIIEDARAYVAVTRKKYDVVASEPTNPWIAGVGNLFSKEYYREVDKILKPGGIMAQWVQRYDLSDELLTTILRTVLSVFPYAYVFDVQPSDYVVIASREPVDPDFAAMEKKFGIPAVKKDLERVSVRSVIDILGRQAFAPAKVRTMVQSEETVNTDDHPILEFQGPKAEYLHSSCPEFTKADQRLSSGDDLFVMQYLNGKPLNQTQTLSLISSNSDRRIYNVSLLYPLTRYYLSRWPAPQWMLGLYSNLAAKMDLSVSAGAAGAMGRNVTDPELLRTQAVALINDLRAAHSVFTPQDFRQAIELADRALAAAPGDPRLIQAKQSVMDLMQ